MTGCRAIASSAAWMRRSARSAARLEARRLFQRPEPLQFGHVENAQNTFRNRHDAALTKQAEHAADMDRSEPDRIGDVLLPQGKRISIFADHVARGYAWYQAQQQMSDALLRRTLAQHGRKL